MSCTGQQFVVIEGLAGLRLKMFQMHFSKKIKVAKETDESNDTEVEASTSSKACEGTSLVIEHGDTKLSFHFG
jgi:hypothetical protein